MVLLGDRPLPAPAEMTEETADVHVTPKVEKFPLVSRSSALTLT